MTTPHRTTVTTTEGYALTLREDGTYSDGYMTLHPTGPAAESVALDFWEWQSDVVVGALAWKVPATEVIGYPFRDAFDSGETVSDAIGDIVSAFYGVSE